MKKTYIKPTIEIVDLRNEERMAADEHCYTTNAPDVEECGFTKFGPGS